VKVTLLLADYAQVAEGKLNIIGGGWSVTGPAPTPSAVAMKVEVPWDQANNRHAIVLELVDEDGHPVTFPDLTGKPQPVRIEAALEVGRPPGVRPGTPIATPFAVNVGPLPLAPDSRFMWRVTIDGESGEDWQVAFSTRPLPPGMTFDTTT
jgi:hypothetical protein